MKIVAKDHHYCANPSQCVCDNQGPEKGTIAILSPILPYSLSGTSIIPNKPANSYKFCHTTYSNIPYSYSGK
jgi:hypothetical protein